MSNAEKMSAAELISRVYGPYAFGVVSLLIVWLVVVKPELEAQRVNFSAQTEVLVQMKEIQQSQHLVSQNLAKTAAVLERIVERYEKQTGDTGE